MVKNKIQSKVDLELAYNEISQKIKLLTPEDIAKLNQALRIANKV